MQLSELIYLAKDIDLMPGQNPKAFLDRLAFRCYLKSGTVPQNLALLQKVFTDPNVKFNPNHDELGRFTFSSGGSGSEGIDNQPGDIQLVQESPPIVNPDVVPEVTEPLPGMGGRPLPKNPFDLLDQGYEDISKPEAAQKGHYTFRNPQTGDVLRFDEGDPNENGFSGQDHYHRPNPNSSGRGDKFLDRNGNPVPKGSRPSHLWPAENV